MDDGGLLTQLPAMHETLRSTAGSLLAIVKPASLFSLWTAAHYPRLADSSTS